MYSKEKLKESSQQHKIMHCTPDTTASTSSSKCYVRQYGLFGLYFKVSRGNYTAYICVLRYTTARLQVLFYLHHLGGITKVLQ